MKLAIRKNKAGKDKKRSIQGYRKSRLGFMLVLPGALVMLFIFVYPLLVNINSSFYKILMMKPRERPFVGFENYINVLKDPKFWAAFENSFIWTVSSVLLQLLLGLSVALLLNQAIKGRGLFRGLMLIPWVTPGVVAAMTWKWMYDGQFGILNHFLMTIGIIDQPIVWLGNTSTAMPAVILEYVWKGFPFVAVMLLATMQTIPRDLYEAASLDGANSLGKFRHVTIPALKPTLRLTTMLTAIWSFNSFDTIWLMTEGGPAGSTETLTTYVYKATFQAFNIGKASAIAVIMFLILLIFVMLFSRSVTKQVE